MLRKIVATLAVVCVLGSLSAFGALSIFTDTAPVPGNAFTTGTVDISTSPTNTLVTFSNMTPGDKVTAPITVSNDGTLQLRYAVTSVATDTDVPTPLHLRTQLDLTIKELVTTCDNDNFDSDGNVLYGGAGYDLGSDSPGINVIGDPTQGFQLGDRTLDSLDHEVLCFQVELPDTTGNAYQGATTTATFSFQAEQTTNNP
jgi:spore coat-associated protein N